MKRKLKLKKFQFGGNGINIPANSMWGNTNPMLDEFKKENLELARDINPMVEIADDSQNSPLLPEPNKTKNKFNFDFGLNAKNFGLLQGLNSGIDAIGNIYNNKQLNESLIDQNPLSSMQYSNGRSKESKYGYSFQKGGLKQNPPKVYTDPILYNKAAQAYNDSLNLYTNNLNYKNKYLDFVNKTGFDKTKVEEWTTDGYVNTEQHPKIGAISNGVLKNSGGGFERDNKGNPIYYDYFPLKNGKDLKVYTNSFIGSILNKRYFNYKKPVQPVVYQPNTHPIDNLTRLNPLNLNLNLNNQQVNLQGRPFTPPATKQEGLPFYGPGRGIIGYTNNRKFIPNLNYQGADNSESANLDRELLKDPQKLKQYVSKFDNYQFQKGGYSWSSEEDEFLFGDDEDIKVPTQEQVRTTDEDVVDEEVNKKEKYDIINDPLGVFTSKKRNRNTQSNAIESVESDIPEGPYMAAPLPTGQVASTIYNTALALTNNPDIAYNAVQIAKHESSLIPTNSNEFGMEGLFQFSPDNQKKYGVNKNSSIEDQVAAYIKYHTDNGTLGNEGVGQLAPAYKDREIIYSKGSKAYKNNSGIDKDGDGNITKTEINSFYKIKRLQKGGYTSVEKAVNLLPKNYQDYYNNNREIVDNKIFNNIDKTPIINNQGKKLIKQSYISQAPRANFPLYRPTDMYSSPDNKIHSTKDVFLNMMGLDNPLSTKNDTLRYLSTHKLLSEMSSPRVRYSDTDNYPEITNRIDSGYNTYYDSNSKEIYLDRQSPEHPARDIITELSHHKQTLDGQDLSALTNAELNILKKHSNGKSLNQLDPLFVANLRDKYFYDTPGTTEYDAHELKEPLILKRFENIWDSVKNNYPKFQNGGPIIDNNDDIFKRKTMQPLSFEDNRRFEELARNRKATKYRPSDLTLKTKAVILPLSYFKNPIVKAIGTGLSSGPDLATSLNYAVDGQYGKAGEDFGQAVLNLIPGARFIKEGLKGEKIYKTIKGIKFLKGVSDIKTGSEAFQRGGINDNNGYLTSNLHNFTPKKIINSNHITTQGMAFPITANGKVLYPNTGDYIFPTNRVIEKPLYKQGGRVVYASIADIANLKQQGKKFRYV